MADGDIQLTVELNTSDVRTKAEQLRSSVSDLFKNVSGQQLSSSLMNIMTQMDKMYTKSTELEAQLKRIDNTNLSEMRQAYADTELELRKAYEILEQINQSANPEGYSQALATVQQWESALQQISADYDHIAQYGSGGMGYEQYETVASKLNEVNNQMVVLQVRAESASSKMGQVGSQASSSANQTESAFNRVGTSVSNVGTQAANSASQVQSSFNSMTSAGQTADSSFSSIFDKLSGSITSSQAQVSKLTSMVGTSLKNAFNKVKSAATSAFSTSSIKSAITTLIKYTIGVRSLYFLFRKLRNAIKEGLENLVQFDSENNATNEAITSLNTSLLYLKNAWAAAFAPIINYVMPVLTSLIDMLADVANEIAKFVGNLTGQSVVLNAVKVQAEDYAESLSDTASSAGSASSATKKLTDRLAAFDDLNVLGKDDDTGSGGSGGSDTSYSPAIEDMFEYVDATSDFAEMVKKAWDTADFTEVGKTVKDKLVDALTIDWENDVYPNAIKVGSSLGSFLAGLFGDSDLFVTVGGDIAGAINTVTFALSAFLDQTSGVDLGGNLADGFNKFLTDTEWDDIGMNVNELGNQILDNISSFFKDEATPDNIASALVELISSADLPQIAFKAVNVLADVGVFLVDTGSAIVAKSMELTANETLYITIDDVKYEVPQEFSTAENPLLAWADNFYFKVGQGISMYVSAIAGTDTEETLSIMENLVKYASPLSALITVIGQGIEWLSNVFSPFIDSVQDFFNNPTSWSNITKFISPFNALITLLTNGDPNSINKWISPFNAFLTVMIALKEAFLNADWSIPDLTFGDIDTFILDMFEGVDWEASFGEVVADVAAGFWNGLSTAWTEGWGTIGDWVADNIITPFCEALGIASPSTVFFDIGMNVIQGLLDGINSLIADVTQIFTDLVTNIEGKWDELKTNTLAKWISLKTSIVTKANEIKENISEKFNAIKDKVVEVSENLRASALEKFIMLRTSIVNVFTTLGDLIKAPINAVIDIVEGFVNKIIDGINSLTSKFSSVSDSLGDVASAVGLPSVSFGTIQPIDIPHLAQGAVIPPNREFMAVLGDQSHGTNIEAPLDTIKQAVAEELSSQIEVLQEGFNSVVQAINSKELAIGDKQIGQASARYNAQQARIRGVNW